MLLVRPLTKHGGRKALYRGGGSSGIIGAIRTALFLGRHPRDGSADPRHDQEQHRPDGRRPWPAR